MSTINPRTREEILLAKIAGEDVSLSNLTPKTARGTYEQILEAIATRLDTIGGATGDASTTAKGVVKQAANVAKAADTAPTKAEFDALIDALVTAGIMAAPANNG